MLMGMKMMLDTGLDATQVPPFKKTLMDAMPYMDFLFGNETEARAFAESEGWTTTDVAEIALKVSRLPVCPQCAHPDLMHHEILWQPGVVQ